MSDELAVPGGEFLLYASEDGRVRLSVRIQEGTVWLPQAGIAELFQTTKQNISLHLQNIYEEGELRPEATVKQYLTVQTEGGRQVRRAIDHYNLDAILAVGYRVRSIRGTQFRQWATAQLRELLVKGFVLDDERLKAGDSPIGDYFEELLARIRDIRASERRFYQKITDIYATSIDYDKNAEITKSFYATVQNKLHWAIHGHTAAEVVHKRADAAKPNMGLMTWKNGPKGKIRKGDVGIAKNYLTEDEMAALNRVVTMYLDYAEDQAQRRQTMHMADWVRKLDGFLQFNERNILTHFGKVTHQLAEEHAHREFDKFEAQRRQVEATQPTSDFDRVVEEVKRLEKEQKPPRKAPPRKPKPGGPGDHQG
ncbi:virulence RhuM family protein [Paludisphaera soli]|uniref:virulence RhuM family protein n=1 Tax=Paludisphaera soli TaxID=2712865 RepID=UPI0013ED9B3F|nr:virulence RhuM family protein [Paludisphaera soli]